MSGPIPPYSNLPIEEQNYLPSRYLISNVQLGVTTLVTTVGDVNYVVGQTVRLIIPYGYGCVQLNQRQGNVVSIPTSNQVKIDIDSSRFVNDFFAANLLQMPQIVAIGDFNSGFVSSAGSNYAKTYIPGSFVNVS
jgi:hypothetical protein